MEASPTKLRALGVCGSLRRGSFNAALLTTSRALAPEGLAIDLAPRLGDISLYDADAQAADGFPEPVRRLGDGIAAADAVIIATPEYNYSVTGVLKNAIDWVSRRPDTPFKNKPVLIQSASGGMLGGARAQYHLRQIMVFLDAIVFTRPEVFVTFAQNKVNPERGEITDEDTRKMIAAQLVAFEAFVRQVRPHAADNNSRRVPS